MDEIIEKLKEIGHEEIGHELEDLKDNMILNVEDFKRELDRKKLKTPELEEFIESYMRWDNYLPF